MVPAAALAPGSIVLASRSPRRRQMLAEAGLSVRVNPPDLDDGVLRSGRVNPERWVMALAYLKARRVAAMLLGERKCEGASWPADDRWTAIAGTILGADTVCVADGEIFGQPRDADDARRMLRLMRGIDHLTITGVCLLMPSRRRRLLFCDAAEVRIGMISDGQIEMYIAEGQWRGKAGAYNLSERIEAGWPIQCHGDPTTVMGLPMNRLMTIMASGSGLTGSHSPRESRN